MLESYTYHALYAIHFPDSCTKKVPRRALLKNGGLKRLARAGADDVRGGGGEMASLRADEFSGGGAVLTEACHVLVGWARRLVVVTGGHARLVKGLGFHNDRPS